MDNRKNTQPKIVNMVVNVWRRFSLSTITDRNENDSKLHLYIPPGDNTRELWNELDTLLEKIMLEDNSILPIYKRYDDLFRTQDDPILRSQYVHYTLYIVNEKSNPEFQKKLSTLIETLEKFFNEKNISSYDYKKNPLHISLTELQVSNHILIRNEQVPVDNKSKYFAALMDVAKSLPDNGRGYIYINDKEYLQQSIRQRVAVINNAIFREQIKHYSPSQIDFQENEILNVLQYLVSLYKLRKKELKLEKPGSVSGYTVPLEVIKQVYVEFVLEILASPQLSNTFKNQLIDNVRQPSNIINHKRSFSLLPTTDTRNAFERELKKLAIPSTSVSSKKTA